MYSIRSRTAIDIFPALVNAHSEKFRFRRHIAAPIDRRPIGARLLKRQQLFSLAFLQRVPGASARSLRAFFYRSPISVAH